MRDDWAVELYAAIARQALRDYERDYHKQGIMDAARWLRLAGLLTEDGQLDTRGITQRRREEEQVA